MTQVWNLRIAFGGGRLQRIHQQADCGGHKRAPCEGFCSAILAVAALHRPAGSRAVSSQKAATD